MKRHVTVCATVVAVAALASPYPPPPTTGFRSSRARFVAGANLVPGQYAALFRRMDGPPVIGDWYRRDQRRGVFIHRHASGSHDRSHCGVGPESCRTTSIFAVHGRPAFGLTSRRLQLVG